jgi:lysophospholipase L1-like esterase
VTVSKLAQLSRLRYMAFGDSITAGDGSSDGNGYATPLERRLREHFARGSVINRGATSTRSTEGVERIMRNLSLFAPAYTLILYGTNDWVECQGAVPCITIDSLRTIVQTVRDVSSLPVLATIIPANPAQTPDARNQWVASMNELIRGLAEQEGAVLADLEAAFLREPDLTALFSDHVHPNDRGYQVMADEFFRAISGGE